MKKYLFLAIILVFLTSFSVNSSKTYDNVHFSINATISISTTNLTAQYELNEASGNLINDTSGNDHNITGAGAFWIASGVDGSGYELAGGGSPKLFSIPDNDNFTFSDGSDDVAFTIDLFFNRTGSDQGSIICKDGVGDAEFDFWITSGGALRIWIFDGDGDRIGRSGGSLSLNVWNHIAVVYDGSGASSGIDMYINGSVSDTGDQNSGVFEGINNTSNQIRVGGDLMDGHAYTTANIDELHIWRRNLTSAEITTLYEDIYPPATTTPATTTEDDDTPRRTTTYTSIVTETTNTTAQQVFIGINGDDQTKMIVTAITIGLIITTGIYIIIKNRKKL